MSSDYGCYNTKKSVLLRDRDVKLSKIGKKSHNAKRKTESYVFSGFDNGIPRG